MFKCAITTCTYILLLNFGSYLTGLQADSPPAVPLGAVSLAAAPPAAVPPAADPPAAVPPTEAPLTTIPPTTILIPPSLKIRERPSLTILPGTDFQYTCEAQSSNNRSIAIVWTKEGGLLPIARSVDDGSGNLKVVNAMPNDSGTYVCTASDGLTSTSQRVVVFVGMRCKAEEFRCADAHCVLSIRRCDGSPDCRDGSDEKDCPLPPPAPSSPSKNN